MLVFLSPKTNLNAPKMMIAVVMFIPELLSSNIMPK